METLKFEELFTEIQNSWQISLSLQVVESLMNTAEFLDEERAVKALIHTMCCKYTLRNTFNPGIGEDEINPLSVDVGLVLSNDYLTTKLTDVVSSPELEDMFVCDMLTIRMIIDLYFSLLSVDPVEIKNMGYSSTVEGKLFTDTVVDKFGLAPLKKEIRGILEKTKINPLSLKMLDSTSTTGLSEESLGKSTDEKGDK